MASIRSTTESTAFGDAAKPKNKRPASATLDHTFLTKRRRFRLVGIRPLRLRPQRNTVTPPRPTLVFDGDDRRFGAPVSRPLILVRSGKNGARFRAIGMAAKSLPFRGLRCCPLPVTVSCPRDL